LFYCLAVFITASPSGTVRAYSKEWETLKQVQGDSVEVQGDGVGVQRNRRREQLRIIKNYSYIKGKTNGRNSILLQKMSSKLCKLQW